MARQIRTQPAVPRHTAALGHAQSAPPTRTPAATSEPGRGHDFRQVLVHATRRPMLQRSPIPTNYGTFDTTKYEDTEDAQTKEKNGVYIKLQFDPDAAKVD